MRFDFDYVVVGAGMSANAAAHGIRERDPDGSILLIGDEADPPYDRPPLSKKLWFKESAPEPLFKTATDTGAQIWTNTKVVEFRPDDHIVLTDNGTLVQYGKVLLATGGTPRTLATPTKRIIYFRTLADYRALRAASGPGKHVIVVGGGFIGTEIACALSNVGTRVTMILTEDALGTRNFPAGIQTRLAAVFADHSITIKSGHSVTSMEDHGPGNGVAVLLGSGQWEHADAVVAGLGIIPNIDLARTAGLPTEAGGVVANRFLQTSDPDVFVAGDIAFFIDPILGRRRIEHADQAEESGKTAGRNMVVADEPYEHTPLFYSDLFDDGYEAVGFLNASFEMFEDWAPGKENAQGVVYYLEDEAVRGVLLWNVWDSTDLAREVMTEFGVQGSVHNPKTQLKGRIPTH